MTVALTLRPVSDSSLQVKQSPVSQPPAVNTVYALTTTEVGSLPTVPAVTAKNLATGQTVTTRVVNGTPAEVGDVITFSIHQLLLHYAYQIAIQFTIGSTVYERYLIIHCKEAR